MRSKWFAEHGLVAHPSNLILLNNLAVALINLGDYTEAGRALNKLSECDRLPRIMSSYWQRAVYLSTAPAALNVGDRCTWMHLLGL